MVCDPDVNFIRNGGLELDFIVIGSDGIFDKLANDFIGETVWNVVREYQNNNNYSLHAICGKAADEILREAAKLKSMDNISIIVIAFKKLQDYLDRIRYKQEYSPIGLMNEQPVSWSEKKSHSQKVNTLFKSINQSEPPKQENTKLDLIRN